jgi:hypothetical protein
MTRHYSRYGGNQGLKNETKRNETKQISCPPFDPQTKVEDKPSGVLTGQIYQCLLRLTPPAILFAKQILPNPGNRPAEMVYQKQHHSMPHDVPVCPLACYLLAPRDTGFTLFQP